MKAGVKQGVVVAAIVMGLLLSGLFTVDSGQVYAAANPGKVTSMNLNVTGQPQANLNLAYVDESLKPGKSYTYKVMPYRKSSKGKMIYGKASPVKKVVNGYSYKKGADGYMTLTGYTGRNETVTTPAKIGKVKVRRIGDNCFRGNVWIKKVKVSGGVSEIGDYAFEACGQAKDVTLPGSLRTIGDGAFNGCAQMRVCDLPNGVTSIGKGAFLYCSHLAGVALPKNLKTMGDFAFAGCERMTELSFNGTALTEIPNRAFCECGKLDRVDIPANVTTIGKRAFSGCKSLELCMIKKSVSIGDYAFERCYPITLYTEDQKASIELGFGVFSSLTQGEPKGEEIRVSLPKDVKIAEGCFYGSRVDGIMPAQETFDGYVLEDGVLYTGDMKTLIAYFPKKVKNYRTVWSSAAKAGELTVPEGVERIASYAFYGCQLKRVNLPNSLKSIGSNAFTKSGVDQTMVYGGANAEDQTVQQETYSFESIASDGIFKKQEFEGYLDVHEDFSKWVKKYIDFNKDNVPMTPEAMPYIFMYTGEYHYRQMAESHYDPGPCGGFCGGTYHAGSFSKAPKLFHAGELSYRLL